MKPIFTLLYDGLCPICRKEVAWLSWWNKAGRLAFQDINATGFDPDRYGKTFDELMAEIHGVYPDGRIVKGPAAFRAAYGAVGLGWLLAPTGWPLLKPFVDWLYAQFAKHRIRLGYVLGAHSCKDGRCDIHRR